MQKKRAFVLLVLCLWPPPVFAGDDPLATSSSPPPLLPDPVPVKAPRFPPELATALVAQPPAGAAAAESTPACSARNPCAIPTPALGKLAVAVGPKMP